MIPPWLAILVVVFVVIGLARPRPGQLPHLQALLAIVVMVVFEGVLAHAW